MKRLVACFIIVLSVCLPGCATRNAGDNDIAIAFYNCENLFDTVHNPGKEDEEFTPQGKYHYTQRLFEQKLHNIATVIQSIGGTDGPVIIGLAEVENNDVLDHLVQQPELARRHYKYEWYDGPDPRGINVAMLYDPAHFSVIKSEPLHVDLTGIDSRSLTRDILHVYGVLFGDTVHLFVNHWPSRRGGIDDSGPKRAAAATVEKKAISSIMTSNPNAKILLMGDFNDNPDDSSIAVILGAKDSRKDAAITGLYNPWADIYKAGSGTEVYQHHWNLFDQVIISGTLLKNENHHLHYDQAAIFKPDFIVDHYKGHEGEPHRSFVGTHWINGYSDHFPVVLYLTR